MKADALIRSSPVQWWHKVGATQASLTIEVCPTHAHRAQAGPEHFFFNIVLSSLLGRHRPSRGSCCLQCRVHRNSQAPSVPLFVPSAVLVSLAWSLSLWPCLRDWCGRPPSRWDAAHVITRLLQKPDPFFLWTVVSRQKQPNTYRVTCEWGPQGASGLLCTGITTQRAGRMCGRAAFLGIRDLQQITGLLIVGANAPEGDLHRTC